MTEKKPIGAPRGNQNARKHGFYSRVLDEVQKLHLDQARDVEGIDEEIAVIRVKLLTLMDQHPPLLFGNAGYCSLYDVRFFRWEITRHVIYYLVIVRIAAAFIAWPVFMGQV